MRLSWLKLIRRMVGTIIWIVMRSVGFATAMAFGPGLLLIAYLFEPHRPLPPILASLPANHIEASQVMQGRVERFLSGATIAQSESRLRDAGFVVDGAANHATYRRRHGRCIEHYVIVWTESDQHVDRTAALFDKTCPGIGRE